MSITKTLFPPANRTAAAVAFLRTFWQVVHGTGILGSGTLIYVSAAQLQHLNLHLVLFAAGAVLASGVLSGALAAGDILANGLPNAYQAAAVASIPTAQVSTVPVVTPADPGQPAAGTEPAVQSETVILAPSAPSAPPVAAAPAVAAAPPVAAAPDVAAPTVVEPTPAAEPAVLAAGPQTPLEAASA